MANVEKRIEKLEQHISTGKRPHVVVFDYKEHADPQAAVDAYRASTPKRLQARICVIVNDPFSHIAVPAITPQAGSVAELLDPALLEGLTKQSARITNGN